MSPSYIGDLVSVTSCSAYSLRSNYTIVLERPMGRMLATLGARSFYAAAPTLWNSLPAHIREIKSLVCCECKALLIIPMLKGAIAS